MTTRKVRTRIKWRVGLREEVSPGGECCTRHKFLTFAISVCDSYFWLVLVLVGSVHIRDDRKIIDDDMTMIATLAVSIWSSKKGKQVNL